VSNAALSAYKTYAAVDRNHFEIGIVTPVDSLNLAVVYGSMAIGTLFLSSTSGQYYNRVTIVATIVIQIS